jgi:hypothetical protein
MIEPAPAGLAGLAGLARFTRSTRTAAAILVSAGILAACTGGTAPATDAPSGAPAGSVATIELPADFPLGAWTSTITEADLEAAGISDPNVLQENAGTFTTTFAADGTWSTVMDTTEPIRWPVFRGTFTPIADGEMEQITTFPPEYAGDVVRFTWRMDGDDLVLGVPEPPDPILPIVTETHPWEPAG